MGSERRTSVAVLLAAYNGMSWIEEQVDSILAQVDVKVDLYISVDISNDGTYEWCQALAAQNQKVSVLPYGERFGGAAKNFFYLIQEVDFSDYDVVSLADQDDIWLPNKLAHAISIMLEKDRQAVSSDVTAFFQDGRKQLIKKSHPQQRFDYFFEAAGPGCTYVFQAQSLSRFKHFLQENWLAANEVTFHDWLIYAYFRQQQLVWEIDDWPLMRYRRHEFNQIGANAGFSAYKKRLLMVRSKWYANEVDKIYRLIDPSGASGLRLDRWFLIRHYRQLRRHPKEALVLLFLLLTGLY